MQHSNKTTKIKISGIRRVFEAAGEDAINLGLGQPDFNTPEPIKKAAITAIKNSKTDGYTKNKGIQPLREAITKNSETPASPEGTIVTAGASEALHIATHAFVDPGDSVIIPDPGFVSYDALTKIAEAEPIPVKLNKELQLEPETVKEAIRNDTKAIYLNSPANPTGAVQTEQQVRGIAEIADDHGIALISDEVYDEFIYEGEHHSPANYAENVITINAVSKTYSMTGWRLGYVKTDPRHADEMIKIHQYIQACASAPSQYAALEALTNPDVRGYVDEMRNAFQKRRDMVIDRLHDMGLKCAIPRGAFYAFPEVPQGFIERCIDNDVILVPGDAFGENGDGYARISYANSMENLENALDIMEKQL